MLPFDAHLEINFWFHKPTQKDLQLIRYLVRQIIELDPSQRLEQDLADTKILEEAIVIVAWSNELGKLANALEWALHQRIPTKRESKEKEAFVDFVYTLQYHPDVPTLRRHVNKVTLWHKLPAAA